MKTILFLLLFYQTSYAVSAPKTNWSQWYTVTVNKIPFMAYREDVEIRKKREEWSVKQHLWIISNTGIIETIVGTVAKDSLEFYPIAMHTEKKYNIQWSSIEGRVKKNQLEISLFSSTSKKKKKLNIALPPNTVFASFAPYYLLRNWKNSGKKVGAEFRYNVISEEGINDQFNPLPSLATFFPTTMKINNKECQKLIIEFNNDIWEWWIDSTNGTACKISVKVKGIEILAVTKKQAKGFLGTKP